MIKKGLVLASILLTGWASAQTVVYSEDFESGAPVDFTIVDNDGLTPDASVSEFTEAWIRIADPNDTSAVADTIMASTSYFDPVGQADRWLITPAITLGAFGNHLYWDARSQDGSFPDDYKIFVSRTDTQLASFTDTVASIQFEFAEWTSRSTDLSSFGLDGETIYIAFVNQTDDGFKLYVDDIRVEIDDPAALDELNVQVGVYPNPTRDVVNIKSKASIEEVIVRSMNGKTMASTSSTSVDLSSFESGVYLLEIKTDKGSVNKRVIKR